MGACLSLITSLRSSSGKHLKRREIDLSHYGRKLEKTNKKCFWYEQLKKSPNSTAIACKEATENIFGPLLEFIFKVKLLQCLMRPEEAAKLLDKKGRENFKRPSKDREL